MATVSLKLITVWLDQLHAKEFPYFWAHFPSSFQDYFGHWSLLPVHQFSLPILSCHFSLLLLNHFPSLKRVGAKIHKIDVKSCFCSKDQKNGLHHMKMNKLWRVSVNTQRPSHKSCTCTQRCQPKKTRNLGDRQFHLLDPKKTLLKVELHWFSHKIHQIFQIFSQSTKNQPKGLFFESKRSGDPHRRLGDSVCI